MDMDRCIYTYTDGIKKQGIGVEMQKKNNAYGQMYIYIYRLYKNNQGSGCKNAEKTMHMDR